MLSQPFPGPLPFWDPSWGPHGTLPGPPWAPLGPGSPHNCNPCGALTTALVCLTLSFAFSMFLVEPPQRNQSLGPSFYRFKEYKWMARKGRNLL